MAGGGLLNASASGGRARVRSPPPVDPAKGVGWRGFVKPSALAPPDHGMERLRRRVEGRPGHWLCISRGGL